MRGYLQHLIVQRSQTAHTRLLLTNKSQHSKLPVELACCQTSQALPW
jgi:hypothetical protein